MVVVLDLIQLMAYLFQVETLEDQLHLHLQVCDHQQNEVWAYHQQKGLQDLHRQAYRPHLLLRLHYCLRLLLLLRVHSSHFL